jgi:hypothetical protein
MHSLILGQRIAISMIVCLAMASCGSPKVLYHTSQSAPNDAPPSPKFEVALLALRDELPKHQGGRCFYLCVGPRELEALQQKLTGYKLGPASMTYTKKDEDGWPVEYSLKKVDDTPATRIHIEFESVEESEIFLTLRVGQTYPTLQVVHYIFRRQGTAWVIHDKNRPSTPKI